MSSSRALRKWVDEQLARGCVPEEMVAAMVAAGHASPSARQTVAEGLARRAAAGAPTATATLLAARATTGGTHVGPGASGGGSSRAATSAAYAANAGPRNTVPEPYPQTLASGASLIDVGDRQVRVLMARRAPRVLLFGNVLDAAECAELIEASRSRMQRSHTIDRATGGTQLHAARTSEDCHFFHDENELLTRLNRRIARLTAWPLANGEPFQILRYGVGAEYEAHYDYFDPADPGSARIMAIGGQRVGTLILYLNTPEAGGATIFPDLDLEIAAVAGNALFFSYDHPAPDTLTLHAGAPVTAGEKWIATRWMRERPYQA